MNEGRDTSGPHSSGPSAFYQRGYSPNPNLNANPHPNNTNANSNSAFPGSQGGIAAPAALRHVPNPSIAIANANTNSNANANAFHSEGNASIAPHHQMSGMGMGMGMGMGFARSEPVKRKRGRPRKYGTDGMALGLSPVSSSHSQSHSFSDKKGRGSGKKAQMAALGSAGQGFTPHVITIAAGEDVSKKILAFLQHGPWAVCVLSANGAISNVTLRQTAILGGTVTYEGRFEILSLSGSFLLTEVGGARTRTGGLSVSLAGPDGRVVGGGVAGLLMAASPVQVVVGTFLADTKKGSGRAGNGEPSSGTLPASMSGCPPSPVAVQSRTEAFGGTSTGQGGPGEQNTGGNSYTLQPQVLNMMSSLHPMDWGPAHFEAETRSNAEAAMTGRAKIKDPDDGSRSYKDEEEKHKDQTDQFDD